MRYVLTDYEWAAIKPFLPNKPRGVPRVNDRPVARPAGELCPL
jgi:transposase